MRISSRQSRSVAGFTALLALALTMAGCAAAPTPDSGAPAAGSPGTEAEFQAARDAYDLKLAQCLRDAGFEVADPKPGQGITETGEGLSAAASVCAEEIGDPPRFDDKIDPAEALKDMLIWTDCLRDRGLEVEDPRLGEVFVLPADATEKDVDACIPA